MSGWQGDDLDDPPPTPDGPGLFGDSPAAPDDAPSPAPVGEPAPPGPYRVLARKYRPTRFEDLIGQDAAVRILRRAFALGRVAHAFMLTGVRGVGKTTTARILARCLTCVGPDGTGGPTAEPCGVCPNCRAILADRHPDVVEMDAASRTGVDDVREIIEATRFRPMQARAKVFIVDEVHMLSRNAFNALLKTLEEPPAHVTFVFATTELRKVPLTVLSRCQRFDLRRVGIAELAGHFGRIAALEGAVVAPDALEMIARAADGSVRDGLSLLDQAIAQGERGSEPEGDGPDPTPGRGAASGGAPGGARTAVSAGQVAQMLGQADRGLVFDLLEAAMEGRTADVLAATAGAHEQGADLGLLLGDLLELVHTLTRLRTVPSLRGGDSLPEAERTRGAALADRLSIPTLSRAWQMLLKGAGEMELAPDRRACADMVLVRLCHASGLPTPGELVRQLSGAPPAAQESAQAAARDSRQDPARNAAQGSTRPAHASAAADASATTAQPGDEPGRHAAPPDARPGPHEPAPPGAATARPAAGEAAHGPVQAPAVAPASPPWDTTASPHPDMAAPPSAAFPGRTASARAHPSPPGQGSAPPAGLAHPPPPSAAPGQPSPARFPPSSSPQPDNHAPPDAARIPGHPAGPPRPSRPGAVPGSPAPAGSALAGSPSIRSAPAGDPAPGPSHSLAGGPSGGSSATRAGTGPAAVIAAQAARPGLRPAGDALARLEQPEPDPPLAPPVPDLPGSDAPGPDSPPPARSAPEAAEAPASPRSFREVVALAEARRQPALHAHLRQAMHLVRFAPGVIELRPEPSAPRDLAARLSAFLLEATGARWTIALSAAPGEPTLEAQADSFQAARNSAASTHPLVLAILDAFPGATVGPVRDSAADDYGLPARDGLALGEGGGFDERADPLAPGDASGWNASEDPDMPEFAPPDAQASEDMPD